MKLSLAERMAIGRVRGPLPVADFVRMCHWHCCQNKPAPGERLCKTHLKLEALNKTIPLPKPASRDNT